MNNNPKTRDASHAGSWYSADQAELEEQLKGFLANASKLDNTDGLKSLIVPHAGYTYSGPTAAWAYININPSKFTRVVLLGPSHHTYLLGGGLTRCSKFSTPLGDISIDTDEVKKLSKKEGFSLLSIDADEAEHSLEMQLPFLRLMFNTTDFLLLPIMVGQTDTDMDKMLAKHLVEYYNDPNTLFVISSDFCHWGKRFGYTYYDNSFKTIWESIENLDQKGMEAISSLSCETFDKYLSQYQNTICGRRPISILLATIEEHLTSEKKATGTNTIKFVKYDQSEKVTKMSSSSVSYAAGVNILGEK